MQINAGSKEVRTGKPLPGAKKSSGECVIQNTCRDGPHLSQTFTGKTSVLLPTVVVRQYKGRLFHCHGRPGSAGQSKPAEFVCFLETIVQSHSLILDSR